MTMPPPTQTGIMSFLGFPSLRARPAPVSITLARQRSLLADPGARRGVIYLIPIVDPAGAWRCAPAAYERF